MKVDRNCLLLWVGIVLMGSQSSHASDRTYNSGLTNASTASGRVRADDATRTAIADKLRLADALKNAKINERKLKTDNAVLTTQVETQANIILDLQAQLAALQQPKEEQDSLLGLLDDSILSVDQSILLPGQGEDVDDVLTDLDAWGQKAKNFESILRGLRDGAKSGCVNPHDFNHNIAMQCLMYAEAESKQNAKLLNLFVALGLLPGDLRSQKLVETIRKAVRAHSYEASSSGSFQSAKGAVTKKKRSTRKRNEKRRAKEKAAKEAARAASPKNGS